MTGVSWVSYLCTFFPTQFSLKVKIMLSEVMHHPSSDLKNLDSKTWQNPGDRAMDRISELQPPTQTIG